MSAVYEEPRLVERRLVKVRSAGASGDSKRGSGWAIGSRGVLTARHVVTPYLSSSGQVGYCAAVPSPHPDAAAFKCSVVWQDEESDIALLAIDPAQAASWVAAVGSGPGPRLSAPGTATLNVVVVGYPDATVNDNFPHPELAPALLLPAGGAVNGHMPVDIEDVSVPEDSKLWEGASGAAVRERGPEGRIVGVICRADTTRQQRRLYASPLPNPGTNTEFAKALAEVGAQPVLEATNAPQVRRLLAHWDETGRPFSVGNVPKLSYFGARIARTDVDTGGNPYFPYVYRPLDQDLAITLGRRAAGTERRMLLLLGDAMSGKSRTGANALAADPVLSNWPLLIPDTHADLREVADLATGEGAVLWLDDVNRYRAGISEGLLRYFADRTGLVVVATLRSDVLTDALADRDLTSVWEWVDKKEFVEQFVLPNEWSPQEQQALAGTADVIREKVAAGLTLGEVLGSAEELHKRLVHADSHSKAVAFAVIDWARTGLTGGIPVETAEQLWTGYLTKKDILVARTKDVAELHEDFQRAVNWARQAIPQTTTTLITAHGGLLQPEDYLVAHPLPEQTSVPLHVWEAALQYATACETPTTINWFAYNAVNADQVDIAKRGWERLAYGTGNGDPLALLNLGIMYKKKGDWKEAEKAYLCAVASRHPAYAPEAELRLGDVYNESGDWEGALTAYRNVIASRDPEVSPVALLNLGVLLEKKGNWDEAAAAYRSAIDSHYPETAARAAFNLGLALKSRGFFEGAAEAYQIAIDSHHPTASPSAALNLGLLLDEKGEWKEAEEAYRIAVDSNLSSDAPAAALRLGFLLKNRGDLAGAAEVWQAAADSQHPDYAPQAALRLGNLLKDKGNLEEAIAVMQTVIDSHHPDASPVASLGLGMLLEKLGNTEGAIIAWQEAVDSHHPEAAPAASVPLGFLLKEKGDSEGAAAAWRAAIASGNPEAARLASINLESLTEKGRSRPAKEVPTAANLPRQFNTKSRPEV
ncbi:tetratricopeptide repeat-containing serine protease family protein [Pseudarthrobacter oxydans]|uniref:tetratricopeptide repeat-containing serine protease family protein n=1 Tax=Pseudarthrobacter oxydans TaxID=1671 RepID=UPI002AA93983|nr:tetratricopeptide repeat-containing serine protease family protein [Pseudarthrobacter oxydans]WPU11052.1 tetratricopeptide repeat-containing serine protease family protein [Pseudarthrobacter oxydans]